MQFMEQLKEQPPIVDTLKSSQGCPLQRSSTVVVRRERKTKEANVFYLIPGHQSKNEI